MKIAIISFDQEFSKQLKEELEPDNEVRVYIDSLGMLRDLKEFHPDIIVYDASAGEFAIDDLKFLMTRDKLENNDFKIFISETDPINVEELPKNIKKEIFTKDDKGIEKFISKMKIAAFHTDDFEEAFIGGQETATPDVESLLMEDKKATAKKEKDEEDILMQTPEDIEELFMGGADLFEEEKKEEKKEVKKEQKEESKMPDDDIFEDDIPIEDIESILGELGIEEEEKEEKKEEKKVEKVAQQKPVEEKKKKTSPEDYLAEFEDFFTLESGKKEKKEISTDNAETVREKKEETAFPAEKLEEFIAEAVEESKEVEHIVPKKTVSEETKAVREEEVSYKQVGATGDIASVVPSPEGLKLEINISPEEIKQLIVNQTVEKMVEELRNDSTLQELIKEVQRTFIEKTERELEGLKEAVKAEVKSKLLKKIEDDLKESIKESIKKDVMEITTRLVKQKLEQLFGK